MERRRQQMAWCMVAACRHKRTHLTSYHKCGFCGEMGHGQLECGIPERIGNLRVAQRRVVATFVGEPCTVAGCASRATHTSDAHICDRCGARQPVCVCPSDASRDYLDVQCPLCKADGTIDASQIIYASGSACVVCLEDCPLVLVTPCHHLCLCVQCARRLDKA